MYRPHDIRCWYCLRFPRPSVASRSANSSSTPNARHGLLLLPGYPFPTTPLILRTTVVRDLLSFLSISRFNRLCCFGQHAQLFAIAVHFRHGLHIWLRPEQLLVLEGCRCYARLHDSHPYDLFFHLLFRVMDVGIFFCTNASHLVLWSRGCPLVFTSMHAIDDTFAKYLTTPYNDPVTHHSNNLPKSMPYATASVTRSCLFFSHPLTFPTVIDWQRRVHA